MSRGNRKHRLFVFLLVLFLSITSTFAQDIIILKNGNDIQAIVQEIGEDYVKYKKYDNVNGPNYTLKKTEIFMIRYANGSKDVFADNTGSVVSVASIPVTTQQSVESKEETQSGDPQNACYQGRMDAENYHGKGGAHFALGVLFGPFAMIGTAVSNPTPERGMNTYVMSKNKELFSDPTYINCYKKKAKGRLIGMEGAGWASWILLLLLI